MLTVPNNTRDNEKNALLNTTTAPYTRGHFLAATGQVGSNIWTVNDPAQNNLTQLRTASYDGYRKYSSNPRDPTAIYIAIHSPVELLMTDPAGLSTGYNPSTGQWVNGIVDANYRLEVLGASDGTGQSVVTRVFEDGTPISGDYTIQIIGIGDGPYEIDIVGYD